MATCLAPLTLPVGVGVVPCSYSRCTIISCCDARKNTVSRIIIIRGFGPAAPMALWWTVDISSDMGAGDLAPLWSDMRHGALWGGVNEHIRGKKNTAFSGMIPWFSRPCRFVMLGKQPTHIIQRAALGFCDSHGGWWCLFII
jgi:hypothetical protein